jgi:glycosyltransferase involved in cell wall biosynthesis
MDPRIQQSQGRDAAPQPRAAPGAHAPSGKRLAIVLSHPIQYYSPWFRYIAANADLAIRVFYLWDFGITRKTDPQFQASFSWDIDLLSGYEHELVRNAAADPGSGRFFGFRNPGLTKRLARWRPDAVLVFGYNSLSHMAVIGWARLRGVPLLFRGDSHLLGRNGLAAPKRALLRTLYSAFSAVTYVGQANRRYFEYLGVPRGRLHFSPHCVDSARFNPGDPDVLRAAQAWRAGLGAGPSERIVLFAGKLVAAKQPEELLQAFLRAGRPGWMLVIVGSGEREESLRAAARGAPPGSRVVLRPFANQSEMPALYLAAEIFVLPSKGAYETWGLAVNEAMEMGTPCVVSDLVGCQEDLVEEGLTGWVVKSDVPGSLEGALRRAMDALSEEPRRSEVKAAARSRILGYGYPEATRGLVEALAGTDRARP